MLREEQGLPIVDPWREWWVPGFHKHEDQVGGMVWQLKDLTFASIKGAGHMVPKDKRK
jgi:carboxypeptidase C (cathepsin A)